MFKKTLIGIVAVCVLLGALMLTRIGGMRVLGIEYSVAVNNLHTVAPSVISEVKGDEIVLDDGRRFRLVGPPEIAWAEELQPLLADVESRVRVDLEEGALYVPRRIGFCSFDFRQRSQIVTIPLIRRPMNMYTSRDMCGVKEIKRPAAVQPVSLGKE